MSVFKKYPLVILLYLSVVVTQTSIFFPQRIGQFRKVAGWPLIMYKIEYQRVSDIKSTGEIIHRMIEKRSILMWERVFLNILIWLFLFVVSWVAYHKFIERKSAKKTVKH